MKKKYGITGIDCPNCGTDLEFDFDCDCENCDCEIFEGDEYFEIGGQVLCEDCVRDIYGHFA